MRLTPLFVLSLLLYAQSPVAPRPNPSDYPAHQNTNNATLAAAIVPSKQIEKQFSADIARHYLVFEVAIYPTNNQSFDVDWLDFKLKSGDSIAYVQRPPEIAEPWPEKNPGLKPPVTVTTESGIVYTHSSDPVYGKRNTVGTYEGVDVTNDPRAANPPSPRQTTDPQIIERRINDAMLPQGQTKTPIAGYLFFVRPDSKHRKDGLLLQWFKNGNAADLRLQP